MTFRSKLLFVFSLISSSGVFLSSLLTYRSAKERLKSAAIKEMENTAALIAQQNEIILGIFKTDLLLMADLPLIRETAYASEDGSLVDETCRYFQAIVERTKIFQSINLFDEEARCIASSFPNRMRHLGEEARRHITGHYDVKNKIAEYERLWQRLLN